MLCLKQFTHKFGLDYNPKLYLFSCPVVAAEVSGHYGFGGDGTQIPEINNDCGQKQYQVV